MWLSCMEGVELGKERDLFEIKIYISLFLFEVEKIASIIYLTQLYWYNFTLLINLNQLPLIEFLEIG